MFRFNKKYTRYFVFGIVYNTISLFLALIFLDEKCESITPLKY